MLKMSIKKMRLNISKFEISNIEKLQTMADKPKKIWNHIKTNTVNHGQICFNGYHVMTNWE